MPNQGFFRILCVLLLLLFICPALLPAETEQEEEEIKGLQSLSVIAPSGNLYTKPTPNAPIIDILQQGDKVRLVDKEGDWYIVKLADGRLGWAHQRLFHVERDMAKAADPPETEEQPQAAAAETAVQDTQTEETAPPAEADTAPVAPQPDEQEPPVETAAAQSEVETAAAQSEKEPPVERGSAEATAEEETVQVAEVQVRSAIVRSRPSMEAAIEFGLERGATVAVIDQRGNWFRIRDDRGNTGWSHQRLFQPPQEMPVSETGIPMETAAEDVTEELPGRFPAAVKVRSARVRRTPSLSANVVFGLERGIIVTVIDEEGEWYRIRTDTGQTGWAHQSLFSQNVPDYSGQLPSQERKLIKAVRFEATEAGEEKVIFTLSGFYPPETFALEEENIPKVVCDFNDTRLASGIDRYMDVDGDYVRQIRIGIHPPPNPKVRAVVDLDPDQKYGVEQVFFKKSSLYILTFKQIAGDSAAPPATGEEG